jgi:hypothetical protein
MMIPLSILVALLGKPAATQDWTFTASSKNDRKEKETLGTMPSGIIASFQFASIL